MEEFMNPSLRVRKSARFIVQHSSHVRINEQKLHELSAWLSQNHKYDEFSESSQHPTANDFDLESNIKFFFVVDSLNFCFWPNSMEYEDLIAYIKKIFKEEPSFFSFDNFMKIGEQDFIQKFEGFLKDQKKQLPERLRILRDLFCFIETKHAGSFAQLILSTNFDAGHLLKTIIDNLTNFQDHCVFKGRQVFFYKRAQILTADLNEALKDYLKLRKATLTGKERDFFDKFPESGFTNVEKLTCFADYRVPQVLNEFGVVEYSESLASRVYGLKEIESGSEEECEIRAAMIYVVERLSELSESSFKLSDIQIDWIFWQYGEKNLATIKPFHRVVTIYY